MQSRFATRMRKVMLALLPAIGGVCVGSCSGSPESELGLDSREALGFLQRLGIWRIALPVDAGTTRVSVDGRGDQGNRDSFQPSISADGRCVAFDSLATDLVLRDTNAVGDVFVHDRDTGRTALVSVDDAGHPGNSSSWEPSISADGRFVAFLSAATNLVLGDTNGSDDVFVHDRTTGRTTRVSVDDAGREGDSHSFAPSISANGRLVAFMSEADNLVPGDTNGARDVFVHDRSTGRTTRVSVDDAGNQGNAQSHWPKISADGRFVAFHSDATNLVAGDTNGVSDVFVHDRATGSTTRVSVDDTGSQGESGSYWPSISADGRTVAFESKSTNLVAGDTNGAYDVFVHDRTTRSTTRVSVDDAGNLGDLGSYWPSISADGRSVAFSSLATNLVPGDTNGSWDVFVHDRATGKTTRVSVDDAGNQGNSYSWDAWICADGHAVAFVSDATNLVPGDTNGSYDVFVRETWK